MRAAILWSPRGTTSHGIRKRRAREAIVSIEWRKDADEALEEARSSDRPALFDFNAAPD